jgi:ABC-type phosphate transport system substrate-binding protein
MSAADYLLTRPGGQPIQRCGRFHVPQRSLTRFVKGIGLAAIGCALGLGSIAVKADVVAVVSSKSALTTLTKNEVMDIFLGKRTRFPNGSSAMPIDLTEGSATRLEFYNKLAAMSPAQIKAYWSKIIFTGRGQPPPAVENGAEAKKVVIANPNAISYIDRNLVDSDVKIVLAP